MADEHEAIELETEASSTLEIATNVLVRMEGHGRINARRFLGRCTHAEIHALAACDAPLDCTREVGDRFRATLGVVMDQILKRQEEREALQADVPVIAEPDEQVDAVEPVDDQAGPVDQVEEVADTTAEEEKATD